ncbi:MAG: RNase adapter RapZ [Clostridia bacterium]|nr:RNase adapter RapZ [Clostridia bacterium]
MEFVVITGMSGAGKTQTMKFMEDMGYFCVDNLPIFLLPKFGELCSGSEGQNGKYALVLDVRGGDFVDDLLNFSEQMSSTAVSVHILFLDCSDQILISRHSENKKLHPLAVRGDNAGAILKEREILAPLRERADYVIDTTSLTIWELKARIRNLFGDGSGVGEMTVEVISFGYKYSVPANADLMFDVRFLPNPYYVPELRNLTGNDSPVAAYVASDGSAGVFMDKVCALLDYLIPLYRRESKQALVIAVGCTGGRHRSVAVANELTRRLSDAGVNVSLVHRDIGR